MEQQIVCPRCNARGRLRAGLVTDEIQCPRCQHVMDLRKARVSQLPPGRPGKPGSGPSILSEPAEVPDLLPAQVSLPVPLPIRLEAPAEPPGFTPIVRSDPVERAEPPPAVVAEPPAWRLPLIAGLLFVAGLAAGMGLVYSQTRGPDSGENRAASPEVDLAGQHEATAAALKGLAEAVSKGLADNSAWDAPAPAPVADLPVFVPDAPAPAVPVPVAPAAPVAAVVEPSPAGKALTLEEIVARCEPSVALVKGKRSSGTGFVIAPGIVATNSHVIDGSLVSRLRVSFPSAPEGQRGPHGAELIYADPGRDLAFLRIDTTLPPLESHREYKLRKGQGLVVIGNPGVSGALTLSNAINQGVMSTEAEIEGRKYYQMGISINPGNSGGPVIDDHARVVGVATLRADEQESLGFCIPIGEVLSRLDGLATFPEDGLAQQRSRQNLRAALDEIATTGILHLEALAEYAEWASERGGLADRRDWASQREEWDDRLRLLGCDSLEDSIAAQASVESDPLVQAEAREQLAAILRGAKHFHELWAGSREAGLRISDATGREVALFLGAVRRLADSLGPETAEHWREIIPEVPSLGRSAPARGATAGRRKAPAAGRLLLVSIQLQNDHPGRASLNVGRAKNVGQETLYGVAVELRVSRGGQQLGARVTLFPNRIEPGRSATFRIPTGLLRPGDDYTARFFDANGLLIPYSEEEREELGEPGPAGPGPG